MRKRTAHGKWKARLTAGSLALLLTIGAVPAVHTIAADEKEAEANAGNAVQTEETEPSGANAEQEAAEPSAASYDITPPVIEGVEFQESGQTFSESTELHFTIDAYDADGEIAGWELAFERYNEENDCWETETTYVTGTLEQENETYLCPVFWNKAGTFRLSAVLAYDSSNNLSENYAVKDAVFTFELQQEVKTASVTLSEENFILDDQNADAELVIEVDLGSEIAKYDYGYGNLLYEVQSPSEGTVGFSISLEYDPETRKWTGTKMLDGNFAAGDWKLSSLELYADNEHIPVELPESSFRLDKKFTDQQAPVLEDITIIHSGKSCIGGTVESGTVDFTVTVSDEGGSGLKQTGSYLVIYSPLNGQIRESAHWINLTYDKEKNCFYGSIDAEELYPCEWYVGYVGICDKAGNDLYSQGTIGRFEDWGDLQKDYYFYVQKGGTCTQKIYKDVTVNLYATDGELLKTVTKDAARRSTLKDIFGKDYPVMEEDPELGAFLEWTGMVPGYKEKNYQEDTPLLELDDGAVMELTANYENIMMDVMLTYIDGQKEDPAVAQKSITVVVPYGTTYGQLLEKIKKENTIPDAGGYQFQGWEYYYETDLDSVISPDAMVWLYAQYQKYPIDVMLWYINDQGIVSFTHVTKEYQDGMKVKDIVKDLSSYEPEDASKQFPITGWSLDNFYPLDMPEEEVGLFISSLTLKALYQDQSVVALWYSWVSENNIEYWIREYIACSKEEEKSEEKMQKYFPEVSHNKELDFDSWDAHYYKNEEGTIEEIDLYPVYKKPYIILEYQGNGEREGTICTFVYAVEPGQTFTLPETESGWQCFSSTDGSLVSVETYTVPADVTSGWFDMIWTDDGYLGDLGEDTPSEETKPGEDTPSGETKPGEDTPSGETKPGEDTPSGETKPGQDAPSGETKPEEKPAVTMEKSKVENVLADIQNAEKQAGESGETVKVTVDMVNSDKSTATVVPEELLAEVKGKDVDLVLDMGAYTWTINGKDIKAKDLKDINLEVALDTKAIPSKLVSDLAGGQETRQLSLTYEGDFGFSASLTLPLGKEYQGSYGNLYYYDSTGKLVFMNAGKIDENGNVSLTFSHASDYVIVIGEKAETAASTSPAAPEESAKTGDISCTLPLIALFFGFGLVKAAFARRKYFRS